MPKRLYMIVRTWNSLGFRARCPGCVSVLGRTARKANTESCRTWTEIPWSIVLSDVGQFLPQTSRHRSCPKHGIVQPIMGVLDHVSLVANCNIEIVLVNVHVARNVQPLFVDANQHVVVLVVQQLFVVSRIGHHARQRRRFCRRLRTLPPLLL